MTCTTTYSRTPSTAACRTSLSHHFFRSSFPATGTTTGENQHSNVDIDLGYFLPHSLAVRGFGSWLHTHGGIITIEQLFQDPQLFPIHDRLLHSNYWHLGAGANYPISQSLDLSFSYVTYLAGTDTHYGRGITIGTTWNFSTRTSPTLAGNGTSSSPPVALQR